MPPADRPRSTIVAEPAYCPACDLKHTRQPDWLCPQCGMPVETEAWRSAVGRSAAEPERAEEFPLGSVVGGAILVVTGFVLAMGFARSPVVAGRWPLVAATVLLAVLGFELLFKVSPARWVAIAVAMIALILASEDLLRARLPDLMGDPLPAGIRAALHGTIRALYPSRILFASGLLVGSLLLIAGRPGRWRIAAGVLIAGTLPVAELLRMW